MNPLAVSTKVMMNRWYGTSHFDVLSGLPAQVRRGRLGMPGAPLTRLLLSAVLPLLLVSLANCTQLSAEEKKTKHYERGMAYFKGEKFHEAVIEFKNIIQLDPKDANAYYQLALSHIKLGGLSDLQAAFGELMKTVEIDPTIQDAPLKLGEFYLLSRKPKEARKHADIVLTASSQDPKGHLLRGRSLIVEKQFGEGIRELKQTRELDPDNEQIYVDMAKAFLAMGDKFLLRQSEVG